MESLSKCLRTLHHNMEKIVFLEENGLKYYEDNTDNSFGWTNGFMKVQYDNLKNHSLESLEKLILKNNLKG